MDTYTEKQLNEVKEGDAHGVVWDFWTRANSVMGNTYPELKNRTLSDCIAQWQKRFNGYSPSNQNLMFLNFTRNMVIAYLSKVATTRPEIQITALNKSGVPNKLLAEVIKDVNQATLVKENGDRKFFAIALSTVVKGTAITYEGYKRNCIIDEEVQDFDSETGEVVTKKQERVLFDDVYQEEVPVEDLMILDPYQPDIQLQPALLWRKLFSLEDFQEEFGQYENAKNVLPGIVFGAGNTEFYGNNQNSGLQRQYQIEVIRFYHRLMNRHVIIAGGQVIYDGVMPFKHRKYPFAKSIHEPVTSMFFWGVSLPDKVSAEQDSLNGMINMMDEKTLYSLKPFIMSSDDDLSDQEEIEIGRIMKVSDVNQYVIKEMPGVNAGESNYFSQLQAIMKETAGIYGGATAFTKNGGKLDIRQVMLQQQEANAQMTFSSTNLEDYEADRTNLRIKNIMQFYALPRIEQYGGRNGKQYKRLVYKNVTLNTEIDGEKGIKSVYFQNKPTEEEINQTLDKMERAETTAEQNGDKVKTFMIDVSHFDNHTLEIVATRNSSWMKNQALDQQMRAEYAQQLIGFATQAQQMGQPVNIDMQKLINYVQEAYDIPMGEFEQETPERQPQGIVPEVTRQPTQPQIPEGVPMPPPTVLTSPQG
jgi:hypothetical protein